MGPNVKISAIVCLAFIVGLAWAVNRVAPGERAVDAGPLTTISASKAPAGAETRASGQGFARPSAVTPPAREPTVRPVAVAPHMEMPILPPISSLADRPAERPAPVEASDVARLGGDGSTSMLLAAVAAGPEPRGAVGGESKVAASPIDAAPLPAMVTSYVVQRGDHLSRIAKRTWNNDDARHVAALLAANPALKKRPNKLLIGEKLTIPVLADPAAQPPAVASKRPAGTSSPTVKAKAKAPRSSASRLASGARRGAPASGAALSRGAKPPRTGKPAVIADARGARSAPSKAAAGRSKARSER